jgi:hemoglobin-like flavoprotein
MQWGSTIRGTGDGLDPCLQRSVPALQSVVVIRDTLIRDDAQAGRSHSTIVRCNLAGPSQDRVTILPPLFFELAPDAQRLFPSDMERQHLKLMDMIAAIVGGLDEHELFQSIISHTGRQHARFGVNPSHFVAFGDALIWSLEQQFGPAFTSELREAWIALYNAVRSEMIRAAQEAA